MDHTAPSGKGNAPAEMCARIDQFYAIQMQALDDGDIAAWVDTFTDDGVFVSNGLPEPIRGRSGLAALGNDAVARLDKRGAIRRHFVFNVIVEPLPEGVVRTTCYVPVFDTVDGVTDLTTSTVMRDELVTSDRGLLVRHRTVTRDDLLAVAQRGSGA